MIILSLKTRNTRLRTTSEHAPSKLASHPQKRHTIKAGMNLFQLGNLLNIFLMQISKKTCNSLDYNKNVKKQKYAVTKRVSITTLDGS